MGQMNWYRVVYTWHYNKRVAYKNSDFVSTCEQDAIQPKAKGSLNFIEIDCCFRLPGFNLIF